MDFIENIHNKIVNVYLFVEDIEQYISINSIKININEESGYQICYSPLIEIKCQLNADTINHALNTLKYNKLMEYSLDGHYSFCKKDISSDVILYVSRNDSDELLKIIELKNVIISSFNEDEYTISLRCDYYIMFGDIQGVDDNEYLSCIYNQVFINSKRICHNYFSPDLYLYNTNENEDSKDDDYEYDDWDDYYDYYENDMNKNEDNEDIFSKSSKLISKIFSSFYK